MGALTSCSRLLRSFFPLKVAIWCLPLFYRSGQLPVFLDQSSKDFPILCFVITLLIRFTEHKTYAIAKISDIASKSVENKLYLYKSLSVPASLSSQHTKTAPYFASKSQKIRKLALGSELCTLPKSYRFASTKMDDVLHVCPTEKP